MNNSLLIVFCILYSSNSLFSNLYDVICLITSYILNTHTYIHTITLIVDINFQMNWLYTALYN